MKKGLGFGIALGILALVLMGATAQVVTKTEVTHPSVKCLKLAWTSASDGTVVSQSSAYYDGKVIWLATDPGATAPTDNWDLTVTDANGIDVLAGAGADRDTANTEYVAEASLGAVANSKLTVNITNAGDAKTGTIYLYIR